jgi:hypothetical protein
VARGRWPEILAFLYRVADKLHLLAIQRGIFKKRGGDALGLVAFNSITQHKSEGKKSPHGRLHERLYLASMPLLLKVPSYVSSHPAPSRAVALRRRVATFDFSFLGQSGSDLSFSCPHHTRRAHPPSHRKDTEESPVHKPIAQT